MDTADIKSTLTELFREIFDNDDLVLTDDTTAADVPGWDSMKMVLIVIAVEKRFGIRTRSREVDQLRCVGDFVSLIKTKLG